MLIGYQLSVQREQTCTQPARLQFLGHCLGLIEHHGQLPGGDGLATATDELHLHPTHIALTLLVNADDRDHNLLQGGTAMHKAAARALQPQTVDGFGNLHHKRTRQA
ncbi:hypothetical protein D3C76_1245560 [compost metagenome]